MGLYLVERYLAGWRRDEVDSLVRRVAGSATVWRAAGVRHRWSLVLPEDETCLCLFEGPDADTIVEANRAAGAPLDRVVVGADLHEP